MMSDFNTGTITDHESGNKYYSMARVIGITARHKDESSAIINILVSIFAVTVKKVARLFMVPCLQLIESK